MLNICDSNYFFLKENITKHIYCKCLRTCFHTLLFKNNDTITEVDWYDKHNRGDSMFKDREQDLWLVQNEQTHLASKLQG